MMFNCVNININPVINYCSIDKIKPLHPVGIHRSVENRRLKTSHAVRYATCMDAFHTECRGHMVYIFLPSEPFLWNVQLNTTLFLNLSYYESNTCNS
jgi:hypothetical protein